MDSQVLLAFVGFGVTIVTTLGSVLIAYFKLKEGQTTIIGHTNGLLTAANDRAAAASDAVVDIAKTAMGGGNGNGGTPPPVT